MSGTLETWLLALVAVLLTLVLAMLLKLHHLLASLHVQIDCNAVEEVAADPPPGLTSLDDLDDADATTVPMLDDWGNGEGVMDIANLGDLIDM